MDSGVRQNDAVGCHREERCDVAIPCRTRRSLPPIAPLVPMTFGVIARRAREKEKA
jgi:hypothetical protein